MKSQLICHLLSSCSVVSTLGATLSFLAFFFGSEASSTSSAYEVVLFFDFLFLATGRAPPYILYGISLSLMVSPVL